MTNFSEVGYVATALALALALALAPVPAAAQMYETPANAPIDVDAEGAAAPVEEAKMDDDTRTVLLVASAVTFGVGYLTPVIVGAPYGYADQGGWVFVPVAGPVVTIAARKGCGAPGERGCTTADAFFAPGLVTREPRAALEKRAWRGSRRPPQGEREDRSRLARGGGAALRVLRRARPLRRAPGAGRPRGMPHAARPRPAWGSASTPAAGPAPPGLGLARRSLAPCGVFA